MKFYSPLWLLLVTLPTITYWLCSKLNQTIVEFAMCPVVLWIRRVSQPERGKLHLLQASWPQPCTSE
jgi:hypothetical protein